jgi:predicted DNA-binding mobile mystery protein A
MHSTDRAARALDARLQNVRSWPIARPENGWIRAVRDALGLTTKQYALRLGVSQPRVVALEKGEREETLTLANLRRAAEALNCELVYVFAPKKPLAETLRKRAEAMATEQLNGIAHSMLLENKAIREEEIVRMREVRVSQLLGGNLANLWRREEGPR